jgi:AcrR family transcriptional regulator
MTNDEVVLPASVELAWGLRDQARRGPKPGLTLERIVAAGIEVARADGIAAVSMARVAGELGVGTMSLYRYVGAKDELVSVMADTAFGPPRPGPAGERWRAGLTRWATELRTSYRRNPWLLQVPVTASVLGPNNVAWLETALGCLRSTALSEAQKLSTALLVSGFVRNEATLSAEIAGATSFQFGRALARLTDEARFPALRRAIASGALEDDDDLDDEFDFGLHCILDGVAALILEQRGRRNRP